MATSKLSFVTDRDALSYEQARDELASVVKRLEAGGLSLEQSLDLWERGEKLAAICAEWLEGARARLSAAMATRDGAEGGVAGGGASGSGASGTGASGSGASGGSAPDARAPF
jgi:exodeoxyribonuclease VII small subunit